MIWYLFSDNTVFIFFFYNLSLKNWVGQSNSELTIPVHVLQTPTGATRVQGQTTRTYSMAPLWAGRTRETTMTTGETTTSRTRSRATTTAVSRARLPVGSFFSFYRCLTSYRFLLYRPICTCIAFGLLAILASPWSIYFITVCKTYVFANFNIAFQLILLHVWFR